MLSREMNLLFIIWFIISLKSSKCDQIVPALFIFGDSAVDVGNNNYLPLTIARADLPYNGIDFPTKQPTGRFSNGKNAADFFAEKLGLPTSPPYLSLLHKRKQSILTGVNFASGASGILNDTGESLGTLIPLTKQLDYYGRVHRDLVKKLGNYGAKEHLSKSLFVIVTGSNDLLRYYGSSEFRNNTTPLQYLNFMLIATLKAQIKRVHRYGGRKFLVTGVGPVGCAPSRRLKNKGEECDERVNSLSVKYNRRLKLMLRQLKSELPDFNFSYFDTYSILQNIIQKPAVYGFKEVKAACCGIGKLHAELPCIPISSYCSNRSNYVFWDIVHPTEATARILVNTMFHGSSRYTFPINISHLISL
ncbi:GDSL esterase/lipase At5g55050-like [Euphorbia lathyris]|uniref:GDSL esterase/lipase At5g55050-like n=1 Tax=Euphorbia lathyris TaxID=212925 RepID=UPI003313CF92